MSVSSDTADVMMFCYETGALVGWNPDVMQRFIDWYIRSNQMGIIRQADGQIVAVGFAHTANYRKTATIKDAWRTTKDGNSIYIVDIAAKHPAAIPPLWGIMLRCFGNKKWILRKRHGIIRRWNLEQYNKKIEQIRIRFQPLKPEPQLV